MKTYNDTTDCEKFVIREYRTWAKSKAPLSLRLAKMSEMRTMAINYNISHLLIGI